MLIPFPNLVQKYNLKINGILHIGAHLCEELSWYNNFGIGNDKIIWVEANPKLAKENMDRDNSIIIKNFICTDTDDGSSILNISNNDQSSSILEFGTHSKNHPQVVYVDTIEVTNRRIDTMYKIDNIPNNFANFLNIDIQGAELLALKSTGNILNNFDYIYLEVNNDYVYKKCALINEIDDYLKTFKFKRIDVSWTEANWGDAFYIKETFII